MTVVLRKIVALAVLVFGAHIAQADSSAPAPVPIDGFSEKGGEAVYRHVCAACHMQDGRGATGAGTYPSLAANAKLADAGYPIARILHGEKAMPPFAEYLTDRQIADVVNFVRSHFGNDDKGTIGEAEVKAER